MKWSNVRLIFFREARDQLRDRRTLFTILVLPLLLYPLMGMTMLQISQFLQEQPSRVRLLNADALPETPALLEDGKFADEFSSYADAELLELTLEDVESADEAELFALAHEEVRSGKYDAVVYFPRNFAEQLEKYRAMLLRERAAEASDAEPAAVPTVSVPEPKLFVDRASDRSRIAADRLERVIRRWRDRMVRENLRESRLPANATEPFQVESNDVSEETQRRAAMWSKILPFIVVIWALTGAFYPAVDLCAGEKERGTLETLLSSPAERGEIVWGKLLTVMAFSMATSLLNLASLGATGAVIFGQNLSFGGGFQPGAPPFMAMGWLVLALIPVSALFSALALAVAAFARSTKEGQYYLLPLLLITLPLIMVPVLPSAQLKLGTSLIPVSGLMMLLRALMEGQYTEALVYLPPVALVTAVCCLLAIRWAVDQFQNESVLFRESERWGLGLWLRHLMRDRRDTPSLAEGILCGLILLMIYFFSNFLIPAPVNWQQLGVTIVITQVALILTPALLMTVILTRSPKRTLLINGTRPLAYPAAILLALALHPLVMWLKYGISQLYPISPQIAEQLAPMLTALESAPLPWLFVLIAVLPAICEELTFRGFILSGLRHMGHRWAAIVVTAVFFGLMHGMLQQSLAAIVMGIVIGYIAVQTGSIFPGILFHVTHNGMILLTSRWLIRPEVQNHWAVMTMEDGNVAYHWGITGLAVVAATALLVYFRRLPQQLTAEEKLQHALDHQRAPASG